MGLHPNGEGVVELLARPGVAGSDRERVLVRGVAPGDIVTVDQIHREGRVFRGRLLSVAQAGPSRREPPCGLSDRCGGCPYMHVDIETQRLEKRNRAARAVGMAPDEVQLITGRELGYRTRARLAFDQRGAESRLGYHRARGHGVVDVPVCPVLAPPVQAALRAVRERVLPVLSRSGEVQIAAGDDGRAVVGVATDAPQKPDAYTALEALVNVRALAGARLEVSGTVASFGESEIEQRVLGTELRGPAAGFAQADQELNERLVRTVLELAEPDGNVVLELFAGYGNLTVALAARAQALTAVERDQAATQCLRENLARAGVNARVVTGDAAEAVGRGPLDVAVLDPPRSGASEVVSRLIARRPRRVVYVSCEPRTLSADVRALSDAGYQPDRCVALDMFPQTAHLETVVRLVPSD